ncbi:MAG: peptidylprolyl isomerase [Microbacteriaceae bacterium]|nr:peptidylprolyl isomerase [Microbacteriaceae bacterium]
MRRFSALVVAASVTAALTACAGVGGAAGCASSVPSGDAASIVEADSKFGSAPEVTFPTPLITRSLERSVLIQGGGETVQEGQPVILEATILNGADASVLQQTPYAADGGSLFTVGDDGLPALGPGLACATVGSRVAVVAPGGENGEAAATEDSIVYVVDVLRAYPSRATGTAQLPVVGMPSVVGAPDGTPGITIPNEDAPTDYRLSVLKRGGGDVVEDDEAVVVKFTAVDWETSEVTTSTWSTGSAAILDLEGTAVSEGLRQAIAGEKIGSQILAVLPPGLAGSAEAPATSTLVYVVDILGTVA